MHRKVELVPLVESAKAYILAAGRFNLGWIQHWHTVQPLADEGRFWHILERFRTEVGVYAVGYGRSNGIEQAANEVFRLVAVGSADYTLAEATSFCKSYEGLKNKLGRALAHLFEYTGDSFSDLMDVLPLAGKAVCDRAIASHPKSSRPRREGFLDERELDQAVREAALLIAGEDATKRQRWLHIFGGENYIESSLENEARHWFLHEMRVGRDGTVWTDEEQEAMSWGETPR